MLQELAIKNFAIIHELRLGFENGMTVLTGETGAGKSIIIDAVGLLAGGRGSSEFIRHGETKCSLEGLFTIPEGSNVYSVLAEYDIEAEEQTLLLQRDIHTNGKNVCRVNGRLVTTAILRHIGENMIDIHGQNEHQELMRPEQHLSMLDQFARKQIEPLSQKYFLAYQAYQEAKRAYDKWESSEQALAQRLDMLTFQVADIFSAELSVGEEESLMEEKNRLVNYQKIMNALSTSYEALQGEEGAGLDLIGVAMTELETIDEMDKKYKELSETITNSYFALQEVASDLHREMDQLAWDENHLNEIETRLELLTQMKRKYGSTIDEVLQYFEDISEELSQLENHEGHAEALAEKLAKAEEEVLKLGQKLSQTRHKVATQLEKEILVQLKELYMEKVLFEIRFINTPEEDTNIQAYHEAGVDQIEFYISANPGEPLKPLAKTASGGELSRIILAMKTIFSKNQGITSIIFDEVDTGVSGRVAQAIATKIHSVAVHSQVLCITHLPQVAAMADHHLFIAKVPVGARTETTVVALDKAEKVEEIARMLSGTQITKLTLEHAKELLTLAENEKK